MVSANSRLLPGLVAAMLALHAANAAAERSVVGGYDANGTAGTSGDRQEFRVDSDSGPVAYSSPPAAFLSAADATSSKHFAAASAAQQTLRASADLAVSSTGTAATTYAAFDKRIVVDAGTSGLNPGDPIRLNLSLRLDGAVKAGLFRDLHYGLALPEYHRVLSSVDTRFNYSIVDLNQTWACGDGRTCYGAEVASLSHSGRVNYDFNKGVTFDAYETRQNYVETSVKNCWDTYTNVGGFSVGANIDEYVYTNHPTGMPGTIGFDLDTGVLSLQFDTFVGNRLKIDGDLDILTQALGVGVPANAQGRFGSTFDAELTSSTPGILLMGETAGVYSPAPVPEPETWALILSGLGVLGALARRRRRTV